MKLFDQTRALTLCLSLVASSAIALGQKKVEDPENGFIAAKVVEVTDSRVSVIAATGVEHVIAIDGKKTRIKQEGRRVSLKRLREGDLVNIVLDSDNPVKFAKSIAMVDRASEMAFR